MWDRQHIEELYRAHGFAVFRRCQRLLRNEEDARDAVQEVFLDALSRPDAFQGQAKPSTYLFAAATNLCLRRLRDHGRRDGAWIDGLLASTESVGPDPERKVAAQQLAQALLSDADEITASIAVYHFVDGLSQGEIGTLVGLSRVSVNQRLQRFRGRAKELEEST